MEEQYSSAETMEEQPAQRQPPALERGLSIKSREPREPLTNITGGDQAPKKGGLVLHPHSRFKICWDIISTLALIYNIVVVPYRIAFDSHVYCPNRGCPTGCTPTLSRHSATAQSARNEIDDRHFRRAR